jgi:hypothetical protein
LNPIGPAREDTLEIVVPELERSGFEPERRDPAPEIAAERGGDNHPLGREDGPDRHAVRGVEVGHRCDVAEDVRLRRDALEQSERLLPRVARPHDDRDAPPAGRGDHASHGSPPWDGSDAAPGSCTPTNVKVSVGSRLRPSR